jgi:hypothetical protein
LSADAPSAHGLSLQFGVHDEVGQTKGSRSALYEALENATGALPIRSALLIRRNPPMTTICSVFA